MFKKINALFIIVVLACFTLQFSFPLGIYEAAKQPYLDTAKDASYMSIREKAMVRELNLVRTYPDLYKQLIYVELRKTQEDSFRLSRLISETTRERIYTLNGVEHKEVSVEHNNYYESRIKAIKDLLFDLDNVPSLGLLHPDPALYETAERHAEDQSHKSEIDHQGTSGSWPVERIQRTGFFVNGNENIASGGCTPRQIVIQLLIDSGVPGYGHRYNILNKDWEFVACFEDLSKEDACSNYWLQEFAQD